MNIHPNKIAAVLTKAHMIRSVSRRGSVSSYRNEGFTVTEGSDCVTVEYRKTSRPTSQTEMEFIARKTERMERIADLLIGANYEIDAQENLIVVKGQATK